MERWDWYFCEVIHEVFIGLNMIKKNLPYPLFSYFFGWTIHAFTASAACFGVLTLIAIYEKHYISALWFMVVTIIIDAIDGTFARLAKVKSVLPNIDGTLLDNIVDYLNYVVTPLFFLYVKPQLIPEKYAVFLILLITMSSSYQFCQSEAKTKDHFFKGFPCYWNILVFYMVIFNTSMYTNTLLLITFCCLIFIPIKYVYPSRLDYLTNIKTLKILMHIFSIIYGVSSAIVLWNYPKINTLSLVVSLSYVVFYFVLSLYRTYYPIRYVNLK